MRESLGGKNFGVPKTGPSSKAMQYQFKLLLENGDMYFYRGMLSMYGKPSEMKQEFIEQLSAYSWVFDDKLRPKLTGKIGNKNDDILIAMMMVPYWAKVFMIENRYAGERKSIKNYN